MNSKRIEEIAVAVVRNEILKNDFLSDEIPVNDKTPSWDGEIWLYNNKNQKKDTLFGKVPVQIKGKTVKKISDEVTKYPINKSDLNNYYRNGGIFYFVIELIDSENTQIFYLSLLPIDIKQILNEMEGNKSKKTITKKFKKLPSTERALEFLSRNFIYHSRKQGISLIDTIKATDFDSYTTKVIFPSKNTLRDNIFEYGTYMYGRINRLNLDIPLYKLDFEKIAEETDIYIGLNEKVIYDEVVRVIEKGKITLEFGKSFVLRLPKFIDDQNQVEIQFNEQGSLQDRIKDCRFMQEICSEKKISINHYEIPIESVDGIGNGIKRIENYVIYLEEILETFNRLKVSFECDFKLLGKEDIQKIEILRDAIIHKNYSRLKLAVDNCFLKFIIGDLKITLVSLKVNEEWLVFNLFDLDAINKNFNIMVTSKDNIQKAMHSPYIMFEAAELFSLDNLNIKVIESSLTQVDYNNDYSVQLTNNFLLNVLMYFDKNNHREEILDLVLNVYNYLTQLENNDLLNFLNKMQAIKRQREFTWEEKEEIINQKNQSHHSNEILCAFFILLGSKIEFEINFNKLSEEQKKVFISYPIYSLIMK
ncbi:hypothetical protein IHV10_20055 [Fictibacillus sp. 5RED26]|uniref:hypothetical protein n=1 Tax=Fictibacillus sp. 5RED26 TaxID=2745876 RepID=UPI0018CE93A6|nr:hypothetical protein [Fictibacillus sp. 5RED26]MBH0158680.1 hypothetical protein [Fictibacillus sp. 5RED26]